MKRMYIQATERITNTEIEMLKEELKEKGIEAIIIPFPFRVLNKEEVTEEVTEEVEATIDPRGGKLTADILTAKEISCYPLAAMAEL